MEVIQNILIVILAGYMTVDQNGPVVLSWFSVIVGMISGLIMGDMNTGLMIGGTCRLALQLWEEHLLRIMVWRRL